MGDVFKKLSAIALSTGADQAY